MLFPITPHLSEELWKKIGHQESLELMSWPEPKLELLVDDVITIAIQVSGKLRATIEVSPNLSKQELQDTAIALPNIQKFITGLEVKKVIVVPGKIINIVV